MEMAVIVVEVVVEAVVVVVAMVMSRGLVLVVWAGLRLRV